MIRQIPWSMEAEAGLIISAGTDLEIIKNQVLTNTAQLWEISGDDSNGYIVTRIDVEGIGKVFVIVLGEGKGIDDVIPQFIKGAKDLGIKHFRTHVKRKGLIRMWKKHGLEIDHYVLRNKADG